MVQSAALAGSGAPAAGGIAAATQVQEERFIAANPRSAALHQQACDVLPAGHTRSVLYYDPFPLTIMSGAGARVCDADGHDYLNLIGDYAAGVYGHNDPRLVAAVKQALDGGLVLSGVTPAEAELARLIRSRIPSMERVRFCNSGSEADLWLAMMVRAITGRPKLMVFEGAYHGGFLTHGMAPGPLNVPVPLVTARYNDLEGARAAFRANANEIAAIFVEPVLGSGGVIPADRGFLAMLREEASAAGALLVFDEVMCSRLGVGGVQGEVGVIPDLTALGKFWGGGFSFGAFGGRKDLMDRFDSRLPGSFTQGGTFSNNITSMTAGLTGARDIYTPDVCRAVNARGDRLRQAINQLGKDHGIGMQATGLGAVMNLHWTRKPIREARDVDPAWAPIRRLIHLWMLNNGFYTARRGMITLSLPVTDADLDLYLAALDRFAGEYASLLRD